MILNLGSGICNRQNDEIGLDIDIDVKPDVVGNAERLPFKDGMFDEIRAIHVLEHVRDIVSVMNECYRVLKSEGKMTIWVPRFPSVPSVMDPTHVRFFVPETFRYFVKDGALRGVKKTFRCEGLFGDDNEITCVLVKKKED